jgi:hypothetical protein
MKRETSATMPTRSGQSMVRVKWRSEIILNYRRARVDS